MTDQTASSIDDVKQFFDGKAATWSEQYGPGGSFTGRLIQLKAIVEHYTSPQGHALDLGCGTGELARSLAASGRRITACDISEAMLHSAFVQDSEGQVEWIQLDTYWRTLPFAAHTFDIVVAASVLEYVRSPAAVLAECARVLRPEGIMVCTVPNPRHPIRWVERLAAIAARGPLAPVMSHRYSPIESYTAYIRTSRQRHSSRWWRNIARPSGLEPIPCPLGSDARSALRLLTFCRSSGGQDAV